MSNLTIVPKWNDNINQVETTEPIMGGPNGNANLATRQLAENLLWLKNKVESIQTFKIPVGGIIETTVNYQSPSEMATAMGYGTWERYGEGRVTIGQTTREVSDSAGNQKSFALGETGGEYSHKLTVSEMPSHNHNNSSYDRLLVASGVNTSSGSDTTSGHVSVHNGGGAILPSGGDQPHNNTQPYIVVARWRRTA